MRRTLLLGLGSLLLVFGGWLNLANAQPSPPQGEAEKAERGPPVFQWVVAISFTMIILLIICMPSRKA